MPQVAHLASAPRPDATAAREAEAEERRRSFLRMVSHELRTPLNSIIGFSEILGAELHGPLGAPQYQEYAAIIRGSGHKLLKLVNQVLEIARLEGGATDFERWDDGRIVIDVTDNGKGLPGDQRQKLLEPYMTTREGGTGLGLAIVGKILEDHGGGIELLDRSDGMRGARIRLWFPETGPAQDADNGEEAALRGAATPDQEIQNGTRL